MRIEPILYELVRGSYQKLAAVITSNKSLSGQFGERWWTFIPGLFKSHMERTAVFEFSALKS